MRMAIWHFEAELSGRSRMVRHAPGVRTDPTEAARSSSLQQVSMRWPSLSAVPCQRRLAMPSSDLELISAIRDAVPVPLVPVGSSGVADENLTKAVEAGMTKVNISTHLNHAFTDTVREVLAANPEMVDTRSTWVLGVRRSVQK